MNENKKIPMWQKICYGCDTVEQRCDGDPF